MVDSGASMHMLSRKDLNSPELDTVSSIQKLLPRFMTANGEGQTNEEATVYVNDLDLFVTVQIFEDTPAVLTLGKLCEDPRYFIPLKIQLGALRANRCSGLDDRTFGLVYEYILNIGTAGLNKR